MNAKRDELKKRIARQVDQGREKLNKIFQEERVELNKSLVGRFFCEYWDKTDSFTRYTAIESADEWGNLKGFYFDTFDNSVKFSKKNVLIPEDGDHLIKYADEMNQASFESVHLRAIESIQ